MRMMRHLDSLTARDIGVNFLLMPWVGVLLAWVALLASQPQNVVRPQSGVIAGGAFLIAGGLAAWRTRTHGETPGTTATVALGATFASALCFTVASGLIVLLWYLVLGCLSCDLNGPQ